MEISSACGSVLSNVRKELKVSSYVIADRSSVRSNYCDPASGATSSVGIRRRDDLHADFHGEMVRCGANPRALQRDRLARLAHDRDANKSLIPNHAGRRIIVDPAGPGVDGESNTDRSI
jgi:hypothetical protein